MGHTPSKKYTIDPAAYLAYKTRSSKANIKHKEARWNSQVTEDDFKLLIECLAHTHNGTIDVVKHKPTKFVAALKRGDAKHRLATDMELAILNRVTSSPHIVQCLDAFVTQKGCYCLVLEYAPFGNLDKLTRRLKGLGSQMAKFYSREIVKGLTFLHARGIIHRDVKPENMLILATGHVVLADFDSAIQTTENAKTSNRICGTYLTRPPEVWDGKDYDLTVDLWMFGICLYNMASNQWPFLHIHKDKHVYALKTQPIEFLSANISEELADLIRKVVRVNPDERLGIDQMLKHQFYKGTSDWDSPPLSPYYLMSILSLSKMQEDIISNILEETQQMEMERYMMNSNIR